MTLTTADLHMLRDKFAHAHQQGRLRDEDYQRTVLVLELARPALQVLERALAERSMG